jgi:hypothetical protein
MHPDYNVVRIDITPETNMDDLNKVMDKWQDAMIEDQYQIQSKLGVSASTASAIQYLRSRSRWTEEKEQELIDRDKAGNPIDLGIVLRGEF